MLQKKDITLGIYRPIYFNINLLKFQLCKIVKHVRLTFLEYEIITYIIYYLIQLWVYDVYTYVNNYYYII